MRPNVRSAIEEKRRSDMGTTTSQGIGIQGPSERDSERAAESSPVPAWRHRARNRAARNGPGRSARGGGCCGARGASRYFAAERGSRPRVVPRRSRRPMRSTMAWPGRIRRSSGGAKPQARLRASEPWARRPRTGSTIRPQPTLGAPDCRERRTPRMPWPPRNATSGNEGRSPRAARPAPRAGYPEARNPSDAASPSFLHGAMSVETLTRTPRSTRLLPRSRQRKGQGPILLSAISARTFAAISRILLTDHARVGPRGLVWRKSRPAPTPGGI
jgi:hypothetical protein